MINLTSKKGLILNFLCLMVFSSPVLGAQEGHGGGAFVCRDSNGRITQVKLLDFWEATELDNLLLIDSSESTERLVSEAIERLKRVSSVFGSNVEKAYSVVWKNPVPVKKGHAIPAPRDTFHGRQPKGPCWKLEGFASYDDSIEELTVDPEIMEFLAEISDNITTAGARVHEAVYKALRGVWDVQDSRDARKITGLAFAKSNTDSQILEILKKKYLLATGWGDLDKCSESTSAPDRKGQLDYSRYPHINSISRVCGNVAGIYRTGMNVRLYVRVPPSAEALKLVVRSNGFALVDKFMSPNSDSIFDIELPKSGSWLNNLSVGMTGNSMNRAEEVQVRIELVDRNRWPLAEVGKQSCRSLGPTPVKKETNFGCGYSSWSFIAQSDR